MIVKQIGKFLFFHLKLGRYKWSLIRGYLHHRGLLEPEFYYLEENLATCRTVLDVGANRGIYTGLLASRADAVICFEPQKVMASLIDSYGFSNVCVVNAGVGEFQGTATLHVPLKNGDRIDGLASFGSEFDDESGLKEEVSVVRVDDYELSDVDFIKIDVEVFEINVLMGARKTIERCRPMVLVEVEERHGLGNITKTFDFFISLGFTGSFIKRGTLVRIDSDSRRKLSQHGNILQDRYINNFLFTYND